MIIRPAKKSDLKKCERLFSLQELALPTGENITAKDLEQYLDEKYFLIAEKENTIVGAMYGESLKNYGITLWEFSVKDEERGIGIGSALLKKFEENAKKDNRKWIILYAPSKNKNTLEFYRKKDYHKGVEFFEHFKYII